MTELKSATGLCAATQTFGTSAGDDNTYTDYWRESSDNNTQQQHIASRRWRWHIAKMPIWLRRFKGLKMDCKRDTKLAAAEDSPQYLKTGGELLDVSSKSSNNLLRCRKHTVINLLKLSHLVTACLFTDSFQNPVLACWDDALAPGWWINQLRNWSLCFRVDLTNEIQPLGISRLHSKQC